MAQEKLLKKKMCFWAFKFGWVWPHSTMVMFGGWWGIHQCPALLFSICFLAIMVDYSSWVVLDCVEAIFKPYLMVQVENFFNQNNPY